MRFDKNRFELLAGITGRDQYFGKTLRENYSGDSLSEAEEEGSGAESTNETPVDVEGADEGADTVSKEDLAAALAGVLGVDAGALKSLVSGEKAEEAPAEEAKAEEAPGDDEKKDEDLALEADTCEVDDEDESMKNEARLRSAIRKELDFVIKEINTRATENHIRRSRSSKSVAVSMGFKK